MKHRLNSLLVAILAAHCGLAVAHASTSAVATREPIIETRMLIINGDEANRSSHQPADVDITIAQAAPERITKDLRIHAFTDGESRVHFSDVDMLISNAMSEAFSNSASGFTSVSRKPVKNAPYSAEIISEKIQTLPDGNQISRRTSTVTYRDSAGRTRQETRDAKGDVKSIQIHDVVEGSRYVISPSTKTATKIGMNRELQKHVEELTEKAKAMARDGKAPVVIRSDNGDTVVVKRSEETAPDGKKEIREEVKVRVVRAGDTPGTRAETHALSPTNGHAMGNAIAESMRLGPLGTSFQDSKWASKTTTAELGTRDFDGIRAEGKRRSYTIPAGEIGNKNPITVTSETWISPDLQVTVYSKQSDPRTGDSIYRLANVKRSEQPLSLFIVPAEYTLRDVVNIRSRAPKAEPSSK